MQQGKAKEKLDIGIKIQEIRTGKGLTIQRPLNYLASQLPCLAKLKTDR